MKDTRIVRLGFALLCLSLSPTPFSLQFPAAQGKRTVIAAGLLLDGRGGATRNTRVIVEGSRIVAVDAEASPVDIDLSRQTVMPRP